MIVDLLTKNLDQLKAKKITKPATIFDHLANITWKKKPWSELTELDQKSFSPYLINRWLSMNSDLIEIVDMFQQYTIGPLSKKHVYQLYLDFLPKAKMFAKYISDAIPHLDFPVHFLQENLFSNQKEVVIVFNPDGIILKFYDF